MLSGPVAALPCLPSLPSPCAAHALMGYSCGSRAEEERVGAHCTRRAQQGGWQPDGCEVGWRWGRQWSRPHQHRRPHACLHRPHHPTPTPTPIPPPTHPPTGVDEQEVCQGAFPRCQASRQQHPQRQSDHQDGLLMHVVAAGGGRWGGSGGRPSPNMQGAGAAFAEFLTACTALAGAAPIPAGHAQRSTHPSMKLHRVQYSTAAGKARGSGRRLVGGSASRPSQGRGGRSLNDVPLVGIRSTACTYTTGVCIAACCLCKPRNDPTTAGPNRPTVQSPMLRRTRGAAGTAPWQRASTGLWRRC